MNNFDNVGQLALAGIRVLEIGTGSALAYAGKLFSDFGAEVIKVEDAEGDDLRRIPPQIDSAANEVQGALNAWLNTNKRSIKVPGQNRTDHDWVGRLASTCDVVLDARALTQGVHVLKEPAGASTPIEVYFTWFGESGPYSDFAGSDSVCRALAGAVHGNGAIEGPPHMAHDIHTGIVAGLSAYSSAMAALIGNADGSRRYVISIHEAAFAVIEMEAGMVQDDRHPRARLGVNRFCNTHPGGIYKTKAGWIGIFAHTLSQWASLCDAIGHPEFSGDSRFVNGPERMAHADEIDEFLIPAMLARTAVEWFELLGKAKFPAVLVPTMDELLAQKVHRERGAFVPVTVGSARFEGPVVPFPLGDSGPLQGGTPPQLGADSDYYRHDAQLVAKPDRKKARGDERPLRHIRVIDLTMGWAGPLASRTLADFGAEVIKVESLRYPDWWRGTHYTEEFYRDRLYEKNTNFALMNRNKLGITLDLTSSEGRELFLELVKTADIVIENYSTEVLPKLSLDYKALSSVNEQLVMVSMPAFGIGNEWSSTRAYGGTLEQASGLPHHTGFPENPPSLTSYAYGDPIGGLNAGAAALLALLVKGRTGKGRHVNLSQVESMLPMVAPFLIEQSVCGRTTARQGNAHPIFAPHNIYRCAGNDEWIVIAVTNDSQWNALTTILRAPQLDDDISLSTAAGRRANSDRIDSEISAWTARNTADGAMQTLQTAGVSAGIAKPVWQVLEDPHLLSRGFFQKVQRMHLGEYLATLPWYRETDKPIELSRLAPTLGEHSYQVLSGVLGLSAQKISDLENKGVIGTIAAKKAC